MVLGRNSEPTQEELMELQEEYERERENRQAANQLATQAAMNGGGKEPGYWDTIGDPDIGRTIGEDSEHIEEYLATEFSDKFAFGNIRYEDWESLQWRTENDFWTIRNELQDADSNLDDIDMLTMYGETRPTHTNERERRLRSAEQVRKIMLSLSVDARGLRSGTEIHTVAKTEQDEAEREDDGGRISRWLSG